jgi:hypothetical protein
MTNPLRVWARYKLAVGYFATAVAIVVFIWFFARLLFPAPEFYPAWDQRNFYNLATKGAISKVQSIIAGDPNSWSLAGWGLAHQYNVLFALPLAPVFIVFGDSWYVYGMAVALIYGTAATLAVGAIAAILLAGYRPSIVFLAFAATAFVAVTRGAGWYSTIFYYPDIGDAFALALWLLAAIALLRRPTWRRTSVLVLLTLAVITFRRGLIFAWGEVGIGLAVSSAIECCAAWWDSDPREKRARLRGGALRIGHLAASAIVAFGILALPPKSFVRGMLSIGISNAYADWAYGPAVMIDAMLQVMGIIPTGLSVVGYIAGAIVFGHRRFEIIGVGLGAILNIVSWVAILRFVSAQNFIVPGVLFLPLGIGLGLGALAEELRGRKLVAALSIAILLLLASAGRLIDGAISKRMDIYSRSGLPLLQGRVTRLSFQQGMEGPFKEVFARLGSAGPQPRKVLVVASSFTFNDAVAQSAAEALLGNRARSYFFYPVPAVDSNGKLMVSEIIDADYVLVGNPLLTHLPKMNGLKAVRDMFLDHNGAAVDFQSLGEPIAFPGFSVSIYRRVKDSDERTALATVEALEAAVPQRGFEQPSWIEIGHPRRNEIETKSPQRSELGVEAPNDAIVTHDRIAGDGWPARYLSYDRVPMGSIDLRGFGETTCPEGALLTLRAVMPVGAERAAVGTELLASHAPRQAFSLSTVVPLSGLHLELEINPTTSGETPCHVALRHLQLEFP